MKCHLHLLLKLLGPEGCLHAMPMDFIGDLMYALNSGDWSGLMNDKDFMVMMQEIMIMNMRSELFRA